MSETGEGEHLPASRLKSLSGDSEYTARRMREDDMTFAVTHTLFMMTNHWPKIEADDSGMWRRIRRIDFDQVIPEDERDKRMTAKLAADQDTVMAWMVAGWMMYRNAGYRIDEPEAVKTATILAQQESDDLSEFMDDCTEPDTNAYTVRSSDVYKVYKLWATDRGEKPLTQTKLMTCLKKRAGVQDARSSKTRGVRGFTLKTAWTNRADASS